MASNYEWPFYRPITIDAGALQALKAWRDKLPKDSAPAIEFNAPAWAFVEVEPVWAYMVRKRICYIYLFKQRRGIASGFVLNADESKVQLILGDAVGNSLAAALSIVTMRPAAHDRKEV